MATRAAVQTPGDAPAPAPAAETIAAPAPGATVEELQAALAAQSAQMQQLMGMMAGLQANQRAVPAQASAEALPDMADLDLAEINAGTSPVLTRQGWIVPPSYGADPVMLEEKQEEKRRTAALVKLAEAASKKA